MHKLDNTPNTGLTRRDLLATGSLAALSLIAPSAYSWAAGDDLLRIGIIGAGGRGGANTNGVRSQHIAALCDTNPEALAAAAERYPEAQTYSDWRELLEQDGLDAVVVSTADHHHALVSIAAMRRVCMSTARSRWATRHGRPG